jgi:Dolichyl-phosphate-mannose-protein mannosyltransferase
VWSHAKASREPPGHRRINDVIQTLRGWRLSAAIFTLHAIVFVALAAWSWRKWLDPVIDVGRELYVPWELTRGHVLYRDIASLFGPLSPYVNALWFRLFGDSLLTLALCNLAIFAAILAAIYHIVRTAADRITATAAGMTALFLFGFSQYIGVGNYNFVTPYSHEATHGLALCIALVLCLYLQLTRGLPIFAVLAGLCFGMVLLTKPDTSVAAIAAVSAAAIGALLLGGDVRRHLARGLPLFVATAIVPPGLFLIYFATKMPFDLALRGAAGAFVTMFVPGIAQNEFYQRVTGFDAPGQNALRMLTMFVGLVVYFAALAAACWTRGDGAPPLVKRLPRLAVFALGVLLAQLGTAFFALPLVCASTVIVYTVSLVRSRDDRAEAQRSLLVIIWSAMALALLAKILLDVRIVHYGFYLSLPATMTGVLVICWTIPRALERRASATAAHTFTAIALCLIVAAIVPYVLQTSKWYETRVVSIGSGTDRFWASRVPAFTQGLAVKEAYEHLEGRIAPEARLAVLPEGVMLNYLLRRDSPLRVINVMPPEIMAFGEDGVLQSLQTQPPEVIVLIHRDLGEYGYPAFGAEPKYGQRTMAWVMANYRVTRDIGHFRPDPSKPAVQILERTPRVRSYNPSRIHADP